MNLLVENQRQQYKDIGMVKFRFELQKSSINIVSTLFYEQKDLFFLAKIGFKKSFIFQIIFFMFNPIIVIIILIFLKLFQNKQNCMINYIANEKAIALKKKNNHKTV